ncbi:MAG: hypothetical protein ACKOX6_02285 [Bdellovibrio sp.]
MTTLLSCTSNVLAPSNPLREFTTDGCSMASNGTPTRPQSLLRCCVDHDYLYWSGGTSEERLKADESFKACVSHAESPELGRLYYNAVRLGGSTAFKTRFYWGYGWTQKRPDTPLTRSELQQVLDQSRKINWDEIFQNFKH